MTSGPLLKAFAPFGSKRAKLLILGSMPGQTSLSEDEYYAHPRNSFWPILQSIYGGSISTYQEKREILTDNHIALWDVLERCIRPGSLDANIHKDSIICNDFRTFLKHQTELTRIAFNGKASERLFRKHVLPELTDKTGLNFNTLPDTSKETVCSAIQLIGLPSTSPAMAALGRNEKIDKWRHALASKCTIVSSATG